MLRWRCSGRNAPEVAVGLQFLIDFRGYIIDEIGSANFQTGQSYWKNAYRPVNTFHEWTETLFWIIPRRHTDLLEWIHLYQQNINDTQAQIKWNTKALRHWPLWREFTVDRWIPRTRGQYREKCFHLVTSSWSDYSMTWNVFHVISGFPSVMPVMLGFMFSLLFASITSLTHWVRHEIGIIADDIFKCIFLNENVWILN